MQTTYHANTAGTGPGSEPPVSDPRVSRLSDGGDRPRWAIAVFAHNEAGTIRAALESIPAAAADHEVAVYVLANGCTDATTDEVRACATRLPNLWLVEIPIADKANAWNVFIHDLFPEEEATGLDTWFFMDGDVALTPGSMPLLVTSLDEAPDAEAAGGMPGSGRDMDAWRQRMAMHGMLAGNFYALRDRFVKELRRLDVRMPIGLIGEDFLVSWLVANSDWRDGDPARPTRSVFNSSAEFTFRSLSPLRLADYPTYLHRKWRYIVRGLQHEMLIMLLMHEGFASMPTTVEELYARAPLPSRLRWVGIVQTPLRLLAVLKIRSVREAAG